MTSGDHKEFQSMYPQKEWAFLNRVCLNWDAIAQYRGVILVKEGEQ